MSIKLEYGPRVFIEENRFAWWRPDVDEIHLSDGYLDFHLVEPPDFEELHTRLQEQSPDIWREVEEAIALANELGISGYRLNGTQDSPAFLQVFVA